MRLDSKRIVGRYEYKRSDRCPDVIFARMRDAEPRYSSKKPRLAETVDTSFEWADVKCAFKLKRAHATITTRAPRNYMVDDKLEEYQPFLGGLLQQAKEEILDQAPALDLKTIPPSETVSDVHETMLASDDSYPLPPDAQLSVYAAERLGSLPCVTHTVGILIEGAF
ncbi:hypothetical protein OH76DRAFT_1020425 [Lentinus brumalis]|uniref:Uncharacterized protein n=1 Tax=Lentinus brumalis TaxID=2498619 RepID=A0A371CXV2_9APHY|nr:hypothetical protein OH76DRAFT_1020425 [Polyporus brumalis]